MQATADMYALKLGQKAPAFNVKGIDNKTYTLDFFKNKEIVVIVFMCNHCPYVIAYIERIKQLYRQFQNKGIEFIGINANDSVKYPQDSFENMKRFAQEKNILFPYLYDETQEMAKAYGALLTPHVMIFDKERKLVYNGGIDENWEQPEKAQQHWLFDAATALTQGKVPKQQMTPCIGCSIKWK